MRPRKTPGITWIHSCQHYQRDFRFRFSVFPPIYVVACELHVRDVLFRAVIHIYLLQLTTNYARLASPFLTRGDAHNSSLRKHIGVEWVTVTTARLIDDNTVAFLVQISPVGPMVTTHQIGFALEFWMH